MARPRLRVVRDPVESRRVEVARLHSAAQAAMRGVSAVILMLDERKDIDADALRTVHDMLGSVLNRTLERARRGA